MLISPGQASDNPMLAALVAVHREHDTMRFRLLVDPAYSHDSTRLVTPSEDPAHDLRAPQSERHKLKGSRGGRPPSFDTGNLAAPKYRRTRLHRVKHWRGIATRSDKCALTYLGGFALAAILIHHRTHLPDRP